MAYYISFVLPDGEEIHVDTEILPVAPSVIYIQGHAHIVTRVTLHLNQVAAFDPSRGHSLAAMVHLSRDGEEDDLQRRETELESLHATRPETRIDPQMGNTFVLRSAWMNSASTAMVTITDAFGGHADNMPLTEWASWKLAH